MDSTTITEIGNLFITFMGSAATITFIFYVVGYLVTFLLSLICPSKFG